MLTIHQKITWRVLSKIARSLIVLVRDQGKPGTPRLAPLSVFTYGHRTSELTVRNELIDEKSTEILEAECTYIFGKCGTRHLVYILLRSRLHGFGKFQR